MQRWEDNGVTSVNSCLPPLPAFAPIIDCIHGNPLASHDIIVMMICIWHSNALLTVKRLCHVIITSCGCFGCCLTICHWYIWYRLYNHIIIDQYSPVITEEIFWTAWTWNLCHFIRVAPTSRFILNSTYNAIWWCHWWHAHDDIIKQSHDTGFNLLADNIWMMTEEDSWWRICMIEEESWWW